MKATTVPIGAWFKVRLDPEPNYFKRVNVCWCRWLDRYGVFALDPRNRVLFIRHDEEVRFLSEDEAAKVSQGG